MLLASDRDQLPNRNAVDIICNGTWTLELEKFEKTVPHFRHAQVPVSASIQISEISVDYCGPSLAHSHMILSEAMLSICASLSLSQNRDTGVG